MRELKIKALLKVEAMVVDENIKNETLKRCFVLRAEFKLMKTGA